MVPIRDRPTRDLVVIYLAGLMGVLLTIEVIGLFVLALVAPDKIDGSLVSSLMASVDLVIGGVIGFVAGRGGTSSDSEGQ